jgi:hemerythrin superfamily protein
MTDVVTLITKDHRELEKLFGRLKKERGKRPELLETMAAMFIAHSRAEEEKVYPAIAKEAGEKQEVHHGVEEHKEAEGLLRRLQKTDPKSSDFDDRLAEFVDAVTHHVEEEEGEILPGLRKAVAKKRLDQLGTDFTRRRGEELTRLSGGGTGQTKDDLYRKARQLDIPGRSKMTKEQLAKAVEKAGAH